jgi:preprotein translocase subunit SecA
LKAHALFEEGIDYLVQDQKVKIVDENKGRTSEGRRYNDGLHQALEAKAGVPIRPESHAIASITYPNLFAKYQRLAGMTGTAKSSEAEFQSLYDLSVVSVPTNLQFQQSPANPMDAPRHNRLDAVDAVFPSKAEKFKAVVEEAVKSYQEGTPVLIGTLSVEANEYVYAKLLEAGVAPGAVQLLNAEHVRGDKTLENSIIAEAGRSGMITVATNMAGRGVDIKPDHVNYKTLAIRIEELAAAKKPVVVEVANQKEAKRLGEWLEGNLPYRIGEGEPMAGETLIRVAPETPSAASAEVLKGSDFPTGGLYVIGTERAKSRRIDDQLIGRSGRQGQIGKSRFFLSLEDDLFRTFGGSKLKPTLALLGGNKGHIESELVEGLVEKAQARIGETHFAARESTTKYDEVMNTQRETFYAMRDTLLEPDTDLRHKLIADTQDVVMAELAEALPKDGKHSAAEVSNALAEISKKLHLKLQWSEARAPKKGELADAMMDQVRNGLEVALRSFDASELKIDELYRQSLLGLCDDLWGQHIEEMNRMKDSVQWVSVAEQDPEVVYKMRAFEAFDGLLDEIQRRSVVENVPQIVVGAPVLATERKLRRAA